MLTLSSQPKSAGLACATRFFGNLCTLWRLRSRQDPASFVEEDAFEIHLQSLRIAGLGQSLLFTHLPVFDQLEQGLIEIKHPFIRAGLNGGRQFIEAVVLD